MANMYTDVILSNNCNWLSPQAVPDGDVNSYYTYALRFLHDDISWTTFRKKYIENGGDGIFAAWTLCYQEDSIPDVKNRLETMALGDRMNTNKGICPNAELIQKQLMQLTTNQKDEEEMKIQADALDKTIRHFS